MEKKAVELNLKSGKNILFSLKNIIKRIAFSPYLNKEKVKPFYATDLCTRTNQIEKVKNREIRKLKRLAK